MDRDSNLVFLVVTISCLINGIYGNDRPRCNQTFYTTDFNEGPGDGHLVFTVNCKDVDSGPEGELTYVLSDGGKGQFRVDSQTGSVLVEGVSDAERLFGSTGQIANPYTITIIVADKGTPPYSTPVTVFVHISSVNDNTPRLDNLPSTVTVSETEAVGKVISTCTPVDDDVDDSNHGTAYVNIKSGNEEGKFVLNQINCDLMLISPLDFETTPKYTLTLEAYDLDPVNPRRSTKELVIDVEDVNDFRPACVGYNILREVSESMPVATTLTTVECLDKDNGANGQLEYKVSKGDAKLTVDKLSGNVSLVNPLDYEAGDDVLEVEIIVYDLGTPSLSSTVTVVFKVQDADDNPPQWTKTSFNATASENTLIGSIIMTLSATDLDTPMTDLSKITYGLERPCDPDWFLVDKQIGSVVVKSALDWETSSLVTCPVHAFSSDKFENRTITTITIALKDINDRAPIFDKFLFTGSVKEDVDVGTFVLKVAATDPDDGINGDFTFSMPKDSPFTIDPDSGDVTVRNSLDYENKTNYLLTVVAKDKGSPTQTSLTYINIQVDPVNEYDPTISPGISLTVSEATEPGTALTKMTADDQDAGEDGEVEFFLLDSKVPFLLESITGDLRIGIGLDREIKANYDLDIMVKDKSNTTVRSSQSTIRVTVTDVNDNAPDCNLIAPIKIYPPTSLGDVLTQIACTDQDIGNIISYTLTGGDTHGIFEVNSVNGKVTLAGTPVVGSYVLFVDVEDNGIPNLKITLPVPIIIESQLKFVNLPMTISVWENTTVLSKIFTVNTTHSWDFVVTEIVSGNEDKIFNLDSSNGELRIIRFLDWESKNSHTLRIRAVSSNGQLIEDDLTVDVLDINDDISSFDNTFVHIKVVETLPVPASLKIVTASDEDEGRNSEIRYSVLSGNDGGLFGFDENSGDFKLLKELDYERRTSYSVIIQAQDKGEPSLSSTAVVFIEVVNQDDNPLVIELLNSKSHFNLSEDIAVGTLLARINGSDEDAGAEVQFSIQSGNNLQYFTIDKRNGTIYTATSLDYETTHNIALVIKAENSIGVSKTLTLDIDLLDINDNFPVFSKQFYLTEIPHATPANRIIGQVTATDKDSGDNGLISLSIESGNDKNHFRLSGDSLETIVELDSDIQDLYTLIIKAIDKGVPSRSSTTIFQILVNEKLLKPQFSSSSVQLTLEEDKVPGIVFDCDATMTGATEGEQGDLVYAITSGNEDEYFFIGGFTGKIDLVKTLDYGLFSGFSLEILARHRENSGLNDSFTVDISVNQINNHAPKFSREVYMWSIPEDTNPGTTLGPVFATDKDVGEFGEIIYTLEVNSKFSVNSSSGLIKTVAAFDYRVAQSYHFHVTAKDKGILVTKSSSAIVIINIEDINNHIPSFYKSSYEISVPETTVPPVDIFILAAKDDDTGSGGEVMYSIQSGDTTVFDINASTGVLQLLTPLDYEEKTEFILKINAQDKGTPSLNSTTTLTVKVSDVNDHSPVFPFQRIDIPVPFDAAPFTSVYNATATDIDKGLQDSTLNYVIWQGNTNGLFTIDIDTGEIKTGREIDAGDISYDLIVIARDQGIPSLTGSTTIGVRVNSGSVLGGNDFYFSVEEGRPKGNVVGQITKDPTLDVIGYSIISGNYNDNFMIRKTKKGAGVIYTKNPLDRESYSLYQLTVSIQHSTGIKTLSVSVTVTDTNDNDPVPEPSSLSLEIVENTPTGSSVGKITATDADTGLNGDLEFTISDLTPLGQSHFSIDGNGLLTINKVIDFEIFSSLTFIIEVMDKGRRPRTASVPVTVTVRDVLETEIIAKTDDSPSTFKSLEIPYSLEHGDQVFIATPDDFNLTLSASDTVRFASVGSNVFSVDSGSGQVTVGLESFLYPSSSYLQWIVCIVSNATNSLSSKLAMIRIDTFDVNTHMVALVVSLSVDDLELQRTTLIDRLQTYFPAPNVVRIWAIQPTSNSNKRRRLLASESVALVVVILDDAADDVGNVDQTKTFLPLSQLLAALQADPSGTPTAGLSDGVIPITHVVPYVNNTPSDSTAHPANVAFYMVIALAAIVTLVLIVLLVAYFIIQYKKTKGSLNFKEKDSAGAANSTNEGADVIEDEEHLCPPDEETDEKFQDQQEKALMLMGTPLPNARQLPPLETGYGNHPFHSFRPPSRAVKTPMGLKRPIPVPPLDTAKALPKRELPVPKPQKRPSPKKTKKKSTTDTPALTTLNDTYEFDDERVDFTDGRKKMVQSLQEEQMKKSKMFLLNQEAEKRRRVDSMKMRRKTSEAPRAVHSNAPRAVHSNAPFKLKKIKNAWRSPKTSTAENPDYNQLQVTNGNWKSPYEETLHRPYQAKLLHQDHIRNGEVGEGEDEDKKNRRKSFAGFVSPTPEKE